MAAHPHQATRHPAAGQASFGTKLLIAGQWLLTAFGIFCLVGAAMLISLTPEAWPF